MITATCGHRLRDDEGPHGIGHHVCTPGITRGNERCLEFRTLCDACLGQYRSEGLLLEDDEAQLAYLAGPDPDPD